MATSAAKKKAAPKKGAANTITDIHHEPVKKDKKAPTPPVVEEAVVVEEPTLEVIISREVKKFNLADAAIEQLEKDYGSLTIKGLDDKEGYEAAKKAWNLVRSKRTAVENKGLDIRRDYTSITKAIKVYEDGLVKKLTPLEEKLQKLWKDYDDLKAAEKTRLEEEERQQLQTRLDELVGLGMVLQEGYYSLGETITLDVATIRTMNAKQYAKVLEAVKAKAQELNDLKEKADLAEKERLDNQQKEQKKLEEQQKKLSALRTKIRTKEMTMLGFVPSLTDEVYAFMYADTFSGDIKVSYEQMSCEDDDFAALVEQWTNQIAAKKQLNEQNEKQEKEKKLKEMRRKLRVAQLGSLGMEEQAGQFIWQNEFNSHKLEVEHVLSLSDDDYMLLANETIEVMKEKRQAYDTHVKNEDAKRKALIKRKEMLAIHIQQTGMTYDYSTQTFTFKNDFFTRTLTWEDILPQTEEELEQLRDDLTEEIDKAKAAQLQKQEDENTAKELLRQSKLTDAQLFTEMLVYYEMLPPTKKNNFKTEDFQRKYELFHNRLKNLIIEFKPELEAAQP